MSEPIENPDYLTAAQAAAALELKAPAIHSALNEGRLPFVTLYGRKLISRADLEAYKLRTRPDGEKSRGRPRGVSGTLRYGNIGSLEKLILEAIKNLGYCYVADAMVEKQLESSLDEDVQKWHQAFCEREHLTTNRNNDGVVFVPMMTITRDQND